MHIHSILHNISRSSQTLHEEDCYFSAGRSTEAALWIDAFFCCEPESPPMHAMLPVTMVLLVSAPLWEPDG